MLHALPVPADVGIFSLSDRTEVRVRDPDQVTNQPALDLDTLVDAHVDLTSRRSHYTFAYTPRLTLLGVDSSDFSPSLLNTALVAGEWRTGPTLLAAREQASYGTLVPLAYAAAAPAGQPVPNTQLAPAQSVNYASSNTTVSSTTTLRPWVLGATIGYQVMGGVDRVSRESYPFQQGPFALAQGDYRAGRRDHLVTVASGLEATFARSPTVPNGSDVVLVQGQEQWRRAWTRTFDTMLAAGVAEARSETRVTAPVFTTDPTAEASAEKRFGHGRTHGAISLDLRLAPFVNQLTGQPDQRAQATLQGTVTRRKVTFRATATAAESVDQSSTIASKLVTFQLDARYDQSQALTYEAGFRLLAQSQNFPTNPGGPLDGPYTQSTFNQGVLFVALTFRPIRTHF
jgi:hypothetical protein